MPERRPEQPPLERMMPCETSTAQRILARELPVLPLASSLRLQAYRYDMKGLVLSPFGNASFAGVSRENTEEVKKP